MVFEILRLKHNVVMALTFWSRVIVDHVTFGLAIWGRNMVNLN